MLAAFFVLEVAMGQSGWTSAVGLAIESQWLNVPLTGSGNPYTIGIAGSNPLRFQIIEPSMGIEPVAMLDNKDEVDGSIEDVRQTLLAKTYKGQFSFPVDAETLYYWAIGMLGRDVQTTVAASGGGNPAVYDHAMSPYLHAPSFTVEEDLGTRMFGKLTSGAIVEGLSLDFGQMLTAKGMLTGHRHIPNTYPLSGVNTEFVFGSNVGLLPTQMGGSGTTQVISTASPSYVDVAAAASGNGPLTWASLNYGNQTGFTSAYMLVKGQPVTIELLAGSTLEMSRKLDSRQSGGSGYDPGSATGGKLKGKGKLVAIYSNMMLPAAAMDFSQIGLDLLFRGPQIGTTGYYYELEVYLPHMKLVRAPVGEQNDTILINSDYVVRMDTTGAHGIQLRLRNTFNNASMAGLWVPPCVLTAATVSGASATIDVNTSAGFAVGDSVTVLGATGSPYTVSSLPSGTSITFTANVTGVAPLGASVLRLNAPYSVGGLGGWTNN
jgi:hypothetical protein